MTNSIADCFMGREILNLRKYMSGIFWAEFYLMHLEIDMEEYRYGKGRDAQGTKGND